jgi:glycosyltransferase involved in cell wall biosynthesis
MVAFHLAAAQAGLGHEVSIASETAPPPDSEEAVSLIPHLHEIGRHFVGRVSATSCMFCTATRRRIAELVGRADAVHLHSVWDKLLVAAAAECRRQHRPYFVLLNGMLDPWSLAQKRFKKKMALSLVYRHMLDHASGLHMLNADEQHLTRPLGLRPPTFIIPNGICAEEIEPLPPAGEFHAGLPELQGKPYILFLSRLHYKKGLDYLAQAFIELAPQAPDVQLVVAGPDGGARQGFVEAVAAAGLAHRVHLTGPIYGRRKLAALVGAACFCLPSRQEGFSLAITEALACGTPVVVSGSCHFPEVAAVGAGFVLDLDPKLFAGAMLELLNDPALRNRMSQAARELVRQRYDWLMIAQQTIAMYSSGSFVGGANTG